MTELNFQKIDKMHIIGIVSEMQTRFYGVSPSFNNFELSWGRLDLSPIQLALGNGRPAP